MQLNELRALLDIYEEWYLEQKQCPLSEEEDYSLKTAQIVAQQQVSFYVFRVWKPFPPRG